MTTTSLKIPAAIKRRAAEIARRRGMTPHAFMVDAIGWAADAAEQRERLVKAARVARRQALQTGEGYAAAQVASYIERRIKNPAAARPKPRPWRG